MHRKIEGCSDVHNTKELNTLAHAIDIGRKECGVHLMLTMPDDQDDHHRHVDVEFIY